jgi:hypothetical protein
MHPTRRPPTLLIAASNQLPGKQAQDIPNILPLRRAHAFGEQTPARAPNPSISIPFLEHEEHPGLAGPNIDPDEPAWRRALVTPDGVRFTRTPDRLLRGRRSPSQNGAFGDESEGEGAPLDIPAADWNQIEVDQGQGGPFDASVPGGHDGRSGEAFAAEPPDCEVEPCEGLTCAEQHALEIGNPSAPPGFAVHVAWFSKPWQYQLIGANAAPLVEAGAPTDTIDPGSDAQLQGEMERDEIDLGYLSLYSDESHISHLLESFPVGERRPVRSADGSAEEAGRGDVSGELAPAAREASRVDHEQVETVVPEPNLPAVPAEPSRQGRPVQRQKAGYEFPGLEFLAEPPPPEGPVLTEDILEESAGRLEKVIRDFGVKGDVIHAYPGPIVTLYELEPAPGTKSSRVISLADDIARSMSAVSARVAVVPGRNAIGIELPNETRETVYLRELLASENFETSTHKMPLCLGKTIGGKPVIADLARMPHLLMAGTTGSGKSVAINTMILSLLYRFTPEQCRLIMVDPKMLELSVYDGIPHLLTPVVTDPKKAITALRWAVREMEDRYRKMAKLGVRNIDGFNARVAEARENGEVITPARPDQPR